MEKDNEMCRYEGTLEVRAAFETGKLKRNFEEYLERRAQKRVAENLAERLASGLAAAMEERRKQKEAKAKETAEERRAKEAQEQEKCWEEEKEKQKRGKIKEANWVEEHWEKRPYYVSQLIAMDLNNAPIRFIKNIMKQLGVSPAGLLERKELIAKLKQEVPELNIKIDNATVGNNQQQPESVSSSSSLGENFSSMDHNLLQGIVYRTRNIDLELHKLKGLLAQAELPVKNEPYHNSMVQTLNHVDAAQKSKNQSSHFEAVGKSSFFMYKG